VRAVEVDKNGFDGWFEMAVQGVMPLADVRTASGAGVSIFGADEVSTELIAEHVLVAAGRYKPDDPFRFRLVGSDYRLAELEQRLPAVLEGWSIQRRAIEAARSERIIPASDGSLWAEAALTAAPELAAGCQERGYDLDFSVDSLQELERAFDARFRTKDPPFPAKLDVGFGLLAYMGEVIRRAAGGQWIGPTTPLTRDYGLALQLVDGSVIWPRQRLSKRLATAFSSGETHGQSMTTPFQEAVSAAIRPYMHEGRRLFSAHAYAAGLGLAPRAPVQVLELALSSVG
jgi:hypothetical protein